MNTTDNRHSAFDPKAATPLRSVAALHNLAVSLAVRDRSARVLDCGDEATRSHRFACGTPDLVQRKGD